MDWPRGVVSRVPVPGPRVVRWLTGLLAVVLLAVAVLTSVHAASTAQQRDLDHELRGRAAGGAAAVLDYVERSRSITLLLAHDAAIAQFWPRARLSADQAPLSREAEEALQYLERLYPEAIGAACLIGVDGVELARVVRGTIVPESELSPDEAENPFFAPTLRLGPDEVHQAWPYKSADTGDWVVSNSSPLRDDRGRLWGLVHFEVGLDGFRSTALAAGRDPAAGTAAVVDNRTGRVLLDSTGPVGRSATLGRPAPPQLQRLLAGIGASVAPVSATVDGRRVAVAPIPSQPGDVNSWSVVVTAPDRGPANPLALGAAPATIGLAALLLFLLVGLSVRAGHRELRRASYTDELTGLPTGDCCWSGSARFSSAPRDEGGPAWCCSSTSTASRRSTTRWGTTTATCGCARSPPASPRPRARATRWRGSGATSSRCCSPTSRVARRACGSPSTT